MFYNNNWYQITLSFYFHYTNHSVPSKLLIVCIEKVSIFTSKLRHIIIFLSTVKDYTLFHYIYIVHTSTLFHYIYIHTNTHYYLLFLKNLLQSVQLVSSFAVTCFSSLICTRFKLNNTVCKYIWNCKLTESDSCSIQDTIFLYVHIRQMMLT